jgi:hypothetical protein
MAFRACGAPKLANSDANYEQRSLRMNRLFHQSSGFIGEIMDEL